MTLPQQVRARVIATFGRQSLISDAARTWQATRRGRREDVVVGDCVLASITSEEQARIESIEPRTTLLVASSAGRAAVSRARPINISAMGNPMTAVMADIV